MILRAGETTCRNSLFRRRKSDDAACCDSLAFLPRSFRAAFGTRSQRGEPRATTRADLNDLFVQCRYSVLQLLTSPKISPTLFGERALCRLRPAASAHRRQAARARLRAAALLGPPHERPGSAQRCLSAPQDGQDLAASAAFQPGCAHWLPQVRESPV